MSVYYEELNGSPTFSLTKKNITAKRTLLVLWDDLDALVEQFTPFPGNIFATFPGRPFLWVDTIDIKPFEGKQLEGPIGNDSSYQFAQCEVNYSTQDTEGGENNDDNAPDSSPRKGEDPKADTETILSHKVTVGGEFLLIPSHALHWEFRYDAKTDTYELNDDATNRVTEEVNAGVLIPTVEHDITYHRVQFPPWQAISDMLGCVNDRRFAGAGIGTMLFLGANASIEFSSFDTKWWTLEYKFIYKRYPTNEANDPEDAPHPAGRFPADRGWNFFLRPESGRFEPMMRKAGFAAVAQVREGNAEAVEDDQAVKNPNAIAQPFGYIYPHADFRFLFQEEL